MESINSLPERAKQLAAIVDAHSDFGDREGRLAGAIVEALHEQGLLGVWVPRPVGGAEFDPVSSLEVIENLSDRDPSPGCVHMAAAPSGDCELAGLAEDPSRDLLDIVDRGAS